MFNVVISNAAESMADDAYEWYEEQQKGLGDLFLSELGNTLDKLATSPILYTKRDKDVRGVVVPRFPYIVMFQVFEKEVIVYSIFHTSRRPKKKYRKL